MTNIDQFTSTPCPKIDALDVAAYFELSLDSLNPSTLNLASSWGCTAVDLTPAIKNAETITHLFITPEGSLQFNREDYGREEAADGGVDCITGDELSRIISMRLLKDVDQSQTITDGNVYMFNGITNMFEPWDLKTFATNTNNTLELHNGYINVLQSDVQSIQNSIAILTKRVANLEVRMTNAENRITVLEGEVANLKQRVSAIENAIYNWASDKSTPIARGNINIYGDYNNTGSKARGIFTHNPSNNVNGDQMYA